MRVGNFLGQIPPQAGASIVVSESFFRGDFLGKEFKPVRLNRPATPAV